MNAILSRVGVLAIVAVAAFSTGFYLAARHYGDAVEIAGLQGQVSAAKNDLSGHSVANDISAEKGAGQELSAAEDQVKVNDLTTDVLTRKDRGACRLSDADVNRLLGIK